MPTMAAIVHFTPTQAHDLALPVGAPRRSHRRTGPALRVLEGGRSPRSLTRTYARRRVAALVLALVALVAVVALAVAALDLTGSALGSSAAPAAAAGASTGPVLVVQPGDTLWGIARRLQPRGDVTGLVDHLAALHGSGPLEPGDRLPLAGLPGH
jgi:hypothetical protein